MVTSKESKKAEQRGVEQRNAGLQWARNYCKKNCGSNCSGVIYFMDDDNKYDLRLFQQVYMHVYVSVTIMYACTCTVGPSNKHFGTKVCSV